MTTITASALPRLTVEVLRTLSTGRSTAPRHIAAGSGVVKVLNWLYVVADDELFLAGFRLDRKLPVLRIPLFPGSLPEIQEDRKKAKPDLEAVLHLPDAGGKPGHLLAVPSGSRKNRVKGALISLTRFGRAKKPAVEIDFSELYALLSRLIKDLNIEGASIEGDTLSLFHRGNSSEGVNCVINLKAGGLLAELALHRKVNARRVCCLVPMELGALSGVRLTFTDATVLDGVRFFVAAAEDTTNPVEDGKNKGSAIGYIDAAGNIVLLGIIDFPHKVEGIHAERDGEQVRFFLVTDADDRKIASALLSLKIAWPITR